MYMQPSLTPAAFARWFASSATNENKKKLYTKYVIKRNTVIRILIIIIKILIIIRSDNIINKYARQKEGL